GGCIPCHGAALRGRPARRGARRERPCRCPPRSLAVSVKGSWSSFCCQRLKGAGAVWIGFDVIEGAIGPVDQPSIRLAAMVRVERHKSEHAAAVGLPLVDGAVAVCIFLNARHRTVLEVLPSGDFSVVAGGAFDAFDRLVRRQARRILRTL